MDGRFCHHQTAAKANNQDREGRSYACEEYARARSDVVSSNVRNDARKVK